MNFRCSLLKENEQFYHGSCGWDQDIRELKRSVRATGYFLLNTVVRTLENTGLPASDRTVINMISQVLQYFVHETHQLLRRLWPYIDVHLNSLHFAFLETLTYFFRAQLFGVTLYCEGCTHLKYACESVFIWSWICGFCHYTEGWKLSKKYIILKWHWQFI